uniref:KIB1-4 beta-propeller domain-containing protein n=1 Tax=Setaria italica TaxID=4555 RepID=K3YJF3_SETIT
MAATSRRRSLSPPANCRPRGSPPANHRRSRSPPATASSPSFPPDLISEVARRLTSLQDFFALRAACRTYPPLLLVPFEDTESHAPFHPTLRRIHRFRFHRTPSRRRRRVASIIEPYKLHSLACVNGVLYALVTPGYILAVVELSEYKNRVELVLLGGNLDASIVRKHEESSPHARHPPPPPPPARQLHLAECCGELILISTMEFDPRVYHVFKWKLGEAKWERITSLGGCMLFLADDCL